MATKRTGNSTVPDGKTGGGVPGTMPGGLSHATSTDTRRAAPTPSTAQAPASSTFMPAVGATPVGSTRGVGTPAPGSSTFMPAIGNTPGDTPDDRQVREVRGARQFGEKPGDKPKDKEPDADADDATRMPASKRRQK